MMNKVASTSAHQTLTNLIQQGEAPPAKPVVAPARSHEEDFQVVTIISNNRRPIDVDRLNRWLEEMAHEQQELVERVQDRGAELSGLARRIWDAAPPPDRDAIQPKAIAKLTTDPKTNRPHRYNSHFRTIIKQMVDDGYLVRIGDGVRRSA